ncbi:trimeric autotransporter adhesin [Gammaproteobacteria bacterium]
MILNENQLQALTTSQVRALTTAQIGALTTNQIQELTAPEIAALNSAQARALTTTGIAALSTLQLSAMSTSQLSGLYAAFTTTQLMAATNNLVTPLVLDLNGDGVRTVGIDAGVNFDLTATGQVRPVGWVSPQDGLLVNDVNQDGVINNGSELFGSATLLPDGNQATNGFEALVTQDTNYDGVINAKDSGWNQLKVWVDTDQNGESDPSELYSLPELGITQLNFNITTTSEWQGGNWVGLISSYQTADGQGHEMADVWLQNTGSTQDPQSKASGMAAVIASFMGQSNLDQTAGVPQSITDGVDGVENGQVGTVPQMVQILGLFDATGRSLSAPISLPSAQQSNSMMPASNNTNQRAGYLVLSASKCT